MPASACSSSTGRISRVIASYVGENKEFARQYLAGELTVELTPQGTLAERLRAGGAGIGAFYTPTGVGTLVAEGGLPWRYHPDGAVALASPAQGGAHLPRHARWCSRSPSSPTSRWSGPRSRTAPATASSTPPPATSTPPAAMAGRITIVEAERVVEIGEIGPDEVHLPGIFVQRVVELTPEQASRKDIEKRTTRPREETLSHELDTRRDGRPGGARAAATASTSTSASASPR